MIVTSKAFADGGRIPLRHTGFGEDLSPELTIADAPDGTVFFAVVMEDLDVPFRKSFPHWIIWNIPKVNRIPEGLPKDTEIRQPFDACQGTAWGKNGYRGPKQPFYIRKEHRYVFSVFALDCRLSLTGETDAKRLINAMAGHILAEAKLTGTFKPS